MDSKRSFEDGWGETLTLNTQLNDGFLASPTPTSLTLGHPALEGGEYELPTSNRE